MPQPLVYQYSWSKQELYQKALELVIDSLDFWGLPHPKEFHITTPSRRRYGSGGMHFGLYSRGIVYVNVQASTQPPTTRGRVWSYPGSKTDRTAAGILCHEIGHHVVYKLAVLGRLISWKNWSPLWRDNKQAVTGYEPTPEEGFAETFRLYLLNPELLRQARPQRFDFVQSLGLRPITETPWKRVLKNAPEFIVTNLENWVERSRKRGQLVSNRNRIRLSGKCVYGSTDTEVDE